MPKSPFSHNHSSSGFAASSTALAHFMARCRACKPSMPNTYFGRRQVLFRPVICSAQPQSEPGTGWGTPSVRTTGFPLGDWNARRAAIRRIVRGAAKDLLIRLSGILSGRAAQSLDSMQPAGNVVPTGAVLVHQASSSHAQAKDVHRSGVRATGLCREGGRWQAKRRVVHQCPLSKASGTREISDLPSSAIFEVPPLPDVVRRS